MQSFNEGVMHGTATGIFNPSFGKLESPTRGVIEMLEFRNAPVVVLTDRFYP